MYILIDIIMFARLENNIVTERYEYYNPEITGDVKQLLALKKLHVSVNVHVLYIVCYSYSLHFHNYV